MRTEILSSIALGGLALGAPTSRPDRTKSSVRRAMPSGFPGLGGLGGSDSSTGGLGGLLERIGGSGGSAGGLGGLLGGLGGSGGSAGGLGGLGGLDLPDGLGAAGGSSGSGGSAGGLGEGIKSLELPGGLGGSSGSSGGLGELGGLGGLGGSGGDSSGLLDGLSGLGGSSGGLGGMLPSLGGSSENGVLDNEACQPLTFIFARGTSEMGNMGSVIGPPVADALRSALSDKVTVQGVDYPASAAGNAAMGAAGSPGMENLVQQAISQCPDTKIALGGYSQGAMVVHKAAKSLNQVAAAVLFGDPLKTTSVGSLSDDKVKGFCALGDPVCANGVNFMAHIGYGKNAEEVASFIVQAAGV